jgi:isochorismate pyruvate lyase
VRSLTLLRRGIDRLDRKLVPILAARSCLVREVAALKATAAAVRAPRRAAQVVANARRLARRHGMDPALAARIYRGMIAAFIDDELRVQKQRQTQPPAPRTGHLRLKPAGAPSLQRRAR